MTVFGQVFKVIIKDDLLSPIKTRKAIIEGTSNGLKILAPIVEKYAKSRSFKRKGKRGTINKIKGPYSLRYITGDLRNSIKANVTARQLILSAGNYLVPYALVQETGGKVGSAIGNTAATIPARPFLTPVIEGGRGNMEQVVLNSIVERMDAS